MQESALQSRRIEVRGPGPQTLLVPVDLIYKRSEYVRNAIRWPHDDEAKPLIEFTNTPVGTLHDFMVWTYAAEPTVDAHTRIEDVIELAIFADNYFVEALHNQALDVLRHKLGEGEWQIQPHVVQRVYEALHAQTPLRRLIRILLNTARKQLEYDSEKRREVDAWTAVFETSSEIGKDYYVATCEAYSINQVLTGGPCQYHWHRDPGRQDINRIGDVVCPFEQGACFADWDKFVVPVNLGKGGAAPVKMSKKEKMKLRKAKAQLIQSAEHDGKESTGEVPPPSWDAAPGAEATAPEEDHDLPGL